MKKAFTQEETWEKLTVICLLSGTFSNSLAWDGCARSPEGGGAPSAEGFGRAGGDWEAEASEDEISLAADFLTPFVSSGDVGAAAGSGWTVT